MSIQLSFVKHELKIAVFIYTNKYKVTSKIFVKAWY